MPTLEAEIRRIVREELARLAPAPDVYSTHALPPDIRSKDRFHRLARQVPGARRCGRTWVVDREAWRAFRSGGRAVARGDVADVVAATLNRMRGEP